MHTFVSADCVGDAVTIRPTQTQYTQQLVCGGTTTAPPNIEGIKYARTPISGIIRAGINNFTYQVYSSKDNIVNASFSLINKSNDAILNTTYNSCAVAGCSFYMLYTVLPDANFYGKYYLDVGSGLFLIEGDAHWVEVTINAGQSGIKSFFKDIGYIFQEWGVIKTVKTSIATPVETADVTKREGKSTVPAHIG